METFFFDSYALIEINKGSKDYIKYSELKFVTTILNLMEFYYALLKLIDKELAKVKFQSYLNNCIDIDDDIIAEATEFRYIFNKINTKNKISYIDAIGYITAKNLNIKFLTGDSAFEYLDNIEYVK